jgi:hypothetical protein
MGDIYETVALLLAEDKREVSEETPILPYRLVYR